MNIFDDFRDYGQYCGKEPPDRLSDDNLQQLIAKHGREWVDGYIKAMEFVAIDVANMFYTPNDGCGIEHTTHMVRKDLKNYWSHNKILLLKLYPQIEALQSDIAEPKPR